ncbi:hypothetical protein B5F53_16035 [Blautia sp. An249]|uniref:hypothetical protein n=1 Tax=Blautia sp. An249 TaxID=1965603 RepID=UPI000B3995FB|nr:hypothetical protein [Blautia sp. An249]OUO76758.1 hypothetical protein B5F53_16035 [Blautia sp. An249]
MSKILRNSFFSILFFLGFIWLHTFIRLNSYIDNDDMNVYLGKAVIAVLGTLFYYWCFTGILDSLDSLTDTNYRKSATFCDIVCVITIALLIIEITTGVVSIISEQEIRVFAITLSKRYIFDIFAALFFPVVVEMALKSIVNEKMSLRTTIWGIIPILLLSLLGFLFFLAMRNIWLIDLVVINISTVVVGTMKYIFPLQKIKKGNVVGCLILYALLNVLFLSFLAYDGTSFTEFMYGTEWPEYCEGARYIINHASLSGTSSTLLSSAYIHDWLINRNNYILQLLFYGGWIAVAGFILFMAVFLILLFRLLGLKNFRIHRYQLVYTASFTILSVRVIMGTLYSLTLLPCPISLPFGGTYSIITDSIVFGLILYGAWENYKYERLLTYTLVRASAFLNEEPAYHLWVKDENYEEEGVLERVLVKDSTDGVFCDVEWIYADDREFAVFIPVDNPNHQVFLLEQINKADWASVDEQEISEFVMKVFVSCRIPACMEVEDEKHEED